MATNSFPTPDEVTSILTPPEPQIDLSALNPEERNAVIKILPGILAQATATAKVHAEAFKAKELTKQVADLSARNQEMIETEIKKIREANKPPSIEELNKLLSQEYAEMTVKLSVRGEQGRVERTFTIRELPQAIETKLFKTIFDMLVPNIKKFSALEFAPGSSTEQKLQAMVDMLPGALDTMADLCATCLDPYGDGKIDGNWVKNNMSSARIRDVLEAQVAVGRIRDFFSQASRVIPQFLTQ